FPFRYSNRLSALKRRAPPCCFHSGTKWQFATSTTVASAAPAADATASTMRTKVSVLFLMLGNSPSLPGPTPPRGRAWTAAGVFFRRGPVPSGAGRGGPGEGVPAKLLVARDNGGRDTGDLMRTAPAHASAGSPPL